MPNNYLYDIIVSICSTAILFLLSFLKLKAREHKDKEKRNAEKLYIVFIIACLAVLVAFVFDTGNFLVWGLLFLLWFLLIYGMSSILAAFLRLIIWADNQSSIPKIFEKITKIEHKLIQRKKIPSWGKKSTRLEKKFLKLIKNTKEYETKNNAFLKNI